MNLGKTLTKFGSGFLGGFSTGGFAGGLTGGTTAAFVGGKVKPLQSAAIGAGAGFVGGYVARGMNWQGETTTVGPYSFKPLSSYAYDYAPWKTPVPVTAEEKLSEIKAKGPNPLGLAAGALFARPSLDMGNDSPFFAPGAPQYTGTGGYSYAPGKGTNWLPLVLVAVSIFLLGGNG